MPSAWVEFIPSVLHLRHSVLGKKDSVVLANVYDCLCSLSVLPGQPLLPVGQEFLPCEYTPPRPPPSGSPEFFRIAHGAWRAASALQPPSFRESILCPGASRRSGHYLQAMFASNCRPLTCKLVFIPPQPLALMSYR